MSGLGDEVVTRCASCGYALTSRRYAVPQVCPICRAQLDPNSAPAPQDPPGETHARQDDEVTHETASLFTSSAATASAPETGPPSSTPDAHEPEESSPSFGEVTNVTPPATVTSPLDAGELWSEFGEQPPRPLPKENAAPSPRAEPKPEAAPAPSPPASPQPAPSQPAPSPARPQNSFPQSSLLGLSAAADAPRPAQAPARAPQAHDAHAPFSTPNAAPAQVQRLDTPRARGAFEEGVAPKILSRYRSGYRAARVTVVLGIVIRVFGALLGLAVLLVMSVLGSSSGDGSRVGFEGFGLGLFFGGAAFAVFFVLGALVSSLGQLRRDALDSAVNSSPFLTNEERAEVMSLR